jgi:hypothetical protein
MVTFAVFASGSAATKAHAPMMQIQARRNTGDRMVVRVDVEESGQLAARQRWYGTDNRTAIKRTGCA